jgi:hypothetical protein
MSYSPFLEPQGDKVHLSYYSFDGFMNYDLHYRRSLDEGVNWGADTVLVHTTGTFPSASANDSHVYVIWTNRDSVSNNTDVYYTYFVNGAVPHSPSAFDLLLPADRALLTAAQAANLTFAWQASVDPDSADVLSYSFHARVTEPGLPAVNLVYNGLEETSLTINLLTESGFDPPEDSLTVLWWVTANSSGDTIQSSSAFRFRVSGGSSISERIKTPSLELTAMYPNPFNSSTTIRFAVDRTRELPISIFDVLGREVHRVLLPALSPGIHTYTWSPQDMASGLYFVKIGSETHSLMGKLYYIR